MSALSPNNDAAKPQPLEASTLSAALTASDLAKSLAWYRDVLRLTVARTFERDGRMFAASLRAGAAPILLTQDNSARGAERSTKVRRTSWARACFACATRMGSSS